MRLAELTQLGPWGHGISDEAECDEAECDWAEGPGKPRVIEYAARRHVDQAGHVVTRFRVMSQSIFLADSEPPR